MDREAWVMARAPNVATHDWRRWMWIASGVLVLLRLFYAPLTELAPQEAYYWQYARHLDLSYFDHPPMCAWMISLSTRLLGAGELGVRLPAVLSSAALTGLIYSLGARLTRPRWEPSPRWPPTPPCSSAWARW